MKDYFDLLEESINEKTYSDEELREKFSLGLKKLEEMGDYDLVVLHSMDKKDYEDSYKMIIWKALEFSGISSENLTGRQLLNIYDIIGYDYEKE